MTVCDDSLHFALLSNFVRACVYRFVFEFVSRPRDNITTLSITRKQKIGYTTNIGFFDRDFGPP